MSGQVVSEPYRDEDWSGKGRITYYADTATERFSRTGSACITCTTFSRVTGISKTTARTT